MSIAAVFALIMAIAKDIPIVQSWIQQLVTLYTVAQISNMSQENIDALKKAIEQQDQRDAETALGGSTISGQLSGTPGSTVVDTLPGVP